MTSNNEKDMVSILTESQRIPQRRPLEVPWKLNANSREPQNTWTGGIFRVYETLERVPVASPKIFLEKVK